MDRETLKYYGYQCAARENSDASISDVDFMLRASDLAVLGQLFARFSMHRNGYC